MLQILADTMMIATRMDPRFDRARRPMAEPSEEHETRRRGWLKLSGLLM